MKDHEVGSGGSVNGATVTNSFSLDASRGTGMTFLINTREDYIKFKRKKIVAVAPSAVAALLPRAEKTAHSKFEIPILLFSDLACHISVSLRFSNELKEVNMII